MTSREDAIIGTKYRLNDFFDKQPLINNKSAMLRFASYAAIPSAIDVKLLNVIRINFFLTELDDNAEVELLLSPLCSEALSGLYVMEASFRDLLLAQLNEYEKHEMASLLWRYIEENSPWDKLTNLKQAQKLATWNILEREASFAWCEAIIQKSADAKNNWLVALARSTQHTNKIIYPGRPEPFGAKIKELNDTFDKLKLSDAAFNRLTRDFIGRKWFFNEFDEWLKSENNRKIFLISGDPGIGKTAIMAKILQQYCNKVVAYHFCDSIFEDSINPHKFIYSIAAQLAEKFPIYRKKLEDVWQEINFNESIVTLVRLLIISPLKKEKLTELGLIIVDALDEAWVTGDVQTIPQIIKVLNYDLINSPLRFVISTRKTELLIATVFAAFNVHEIEANRTDNLLDIREFLRKKFLEHDQLKTLLSEKKIDSENVIRVICEKSEGNFFYAKILIHAIIEKQIDPLLLNGFPPGLNDFYLTFFQRTFSAQDDYQNKIRPILDIICVAVEPLTTQQMASFMNIKTSQIQQRLNKLKVYFPKQNNVYQPYHKSIIDWLRATKGNDNFRVDVENGHKLIGDELFSLYNDGNRDKFTLGYLPSHLAGSGQWEKLIILLSSLEFIEAKCTAGMTYGLIDDYNKIQTILPQEKWGMLADFSYFVRRQSHVLARYPKLTFQQAINEFDDSKVAQAAVKWSEHRNGQLWLKLVNKWEMVYACRITLTAHINSATYCAYSRDGKKIVSASRDNTIRIWDVTTGRNLGMIQDIALVNSCIFSPDGSKIVSASSDCTIKIWDATSFKQIWIITGHTSPVNCCAFSPDGSRIASASADKTIKIWDITSLNSGKLLFTLNSHTSYVNSCTFSFDGSKIASASADGTIKIWDIISQNYSEPLFTLEGHISYVNCCAFSPDGSEIISASADRTIKIWDVITGKEKLTMDKHQDCVTSCAYSSDGKKIVSASEDRTMKIWDATTGEEEQTLYHTDAVNCCTYSPDDSEVVSATRDNKIRIWDAHTQQKKDTFSGHIKPITCCIYSPDNSRIASASDDKTIKIWNATTGQYKKTLLGHKETVYCCAYSPDGYKIVSASDDKTLKIWNAHTGQVLLTLFGHRGGITACDYSPDGKKIASASWDKTLKIWNAYTGQEELSLVDHREGITTCVYSPDGRKIASTSWDGTLRIWDMVTKQEERTIICHEDRITMCAYSPDGKRIVSASWDKMLKIWDMATGQKKLTLIGHTGRILCCAYSRDGRKIASASDDNTIKIWDAITGQELLMASIDDILIKIIWSADDRFLAGGSRLGNLYIWELMNIGSTKETRDNKIEVFLSYSHKDEDLCNELRKQLRILEKQNLINCWHDRQIVAGTEWESEILGHLERAQIILLLISADFVASDYAWDKEMMRAMERHDRGEAKVIPVILRPADWHEAPFGKLQALPKDGKPVTMWSDKDEAFLDVVQGIKKAITEYKNITTEQKHIELDIKNYNLQESTTSDAQYKQYSNSRFGFRINYPSSFIAGKTPTNGDGVIWKSPDGHAELRVYGSNNTMNESVEKKYDNEIKNIHTDIASKNKGDNWFILRWSENGKNFYKKVFAGQGSSNTMIFSYPASQGNQYHRLISVLEESFKFGDISVGH